jgi:hypothetical protein
MPAIIDSAMTPVPIVAIRLPESGDMNREYIDGIPGSRTPSIRRGFAQASARR